jgi:hypothetical protein
LTRAHPAARFHTMIRTLINARTYPAFLGPTSSVHYAGSIGNRRCCQQRHGGGRLQPCAPTTSGFADGTRAAAGMGSIAYPTRVMQCGERQARPQVQPQVGRAKAKLHDHNDFDGLGRMLSACVSGPVVLRRGEGSRAAGECLRSLRHSFFILRLPSGKLSRHRWVAGPLAGNDAAGMGTFQACARVVHPATRWRPTFPPRCCCCCRG